MNVEHVCIGDDVAHQSTQPKEFSGQDTIKCRLNRTVTDVIYSSEGYLKVRETRKGKANDGLMLNLRFLDPKPKIIRLWPSALLWSALGFGVLAVSAPFVLSVAGYSPYVAPVTAALAAMAVLFLFQFAGRNVVKYQFQTASGRAVVLSLTGTLGNSRKTRGVANRVSSAIAHAREKIDMRDESYLRAEIQAHYRLADTGVISREACSTGNFLILSKLG